MNKSQPLIAVVGRPNVGKSTFFNKVCGKRISIIKDMPGVTRDRIYGNAEWCGYNFTLIDTGGLDPANESAIFSHMKKQAEIAIEVADVILFFTDAKEGLMPADYEIAKLLRASKKPVLLVVNKLDNFELEKIFDFYELGLGDPLPVSCEQSKGLGDLLDEVVKLIEKIPEEPATSAVKIAIVGKPNVGKSSLTNKILGYDRMIVSDEAGTTRDAIDIPIKKGDKEYIIIDTAGIRRKRSIEDDTIESYSVIRAINAIKRADVVLVVFDASEELSEQDVRIAGLVHEQQKPSVIIINKWDLIEKDTYTSDRYKKSLDTDLAFMKYYQPIFVSAITGQRVEKIFDLVKEVYDNNSLRVSTGILNEVMLDAIAMNEPSTITGKRLRFYYATQVEVNPPTFVFFVNDAKLVHNNYLRYLENCFRKAFNFSGTPIKFIIRSKQEKDL